MQMEKNKYDFLIGLDMIKEFNLIQNENLKISQKIEENSRSKKLHQGNNSNEVEDKTNLNIINFNEHVKEKEFTIDLSNLISQQKSEINKQIDKYKSSIAKDKYDIETVRDHEARIDLLLDKYCCKRPYRCSIEDKIEIEEQVGRLLERNLIEELHNPFAAPVTFF